MSEQVNRKQSNPELLDACQTLKEYMLYVERVRTYAGNMILEEAVDRAIISNEAYAKITKDEVFKYYD